MTRRPYLDWLRGIAVLIMIEGHTFDSWTRAVDQSLPVYRWSMVVAGFGAPVFLFLAGITLMLAVGARMRKGADAFATMRAAVWRGVWILALAFLFRLQSLVISGGTFPQSLLKVDILNIIGIAIVVSAIGWAAAPTLRARTLTFTLLTVAAALSTPLVRGSEGLGVLPDWLEAYARPPAGQMTFSLFPWAGFFTAGCVAGAWLDRRPASPDDTALMNRLAVLGVAATIGGYASSLLPSWYPTSDFWTSSPSFFLLRVGVLLLIVAGAHAVSLRWRSSALEQFGRASLFVYWIHVELVYGIPSTPLHGRLPFPVTVLAFIAFTAAMFALVRLKDRIPLRGRPTKSWPLKRERFPAPSRASRNPI